MKTSVTVTALAALAVSTIQASPLAASGPRTTQNGYWAGAAVNTTGVQGVKGSFTVPHVANTSDVQIAIGFDGLNCAGGFFGGVGWGVYSGQLQYYAFYQEDGYLTTPSRFTQQQFSVKPGDSVSVEIVAQNTSSAQLQMSNARSGTTIKKQVSIGNTLCLNSVEWYVLNCQPYSISCAAMGYFDPIIIQSPMYKLASGSSYLDASKSSKRVLITPLYYPSGNGREFAEATAAWSQGNVNITSGTAKPGSE